MFLKSVVTHLAAPLKADIGTNSVKNRHAQNTNNEMKKRIQISTNETKVGQKMSRTT